MADPDKQSEALVYELIDRTVGLADVTNALITGVLRKLDLTHALANALWQLDPAADAPSMRQMAGALHCDPSTVTFLADRLEERQLATRTVDPQNRRVRTLVLTPKGREVRKHLVTAMIAHSPMTRLTTSEQRRLLSLLNKALTRPSLPPASPDNDP
jgi:DNA-binding MarR family transcriptional regulator